MQHPASRQRAKTSHLPKCFQSNLPKNILLMFHCYQFKMGHTKQERERKPKEKKIKINCANTLSVTPRIQILTRKYKAVCVERVVETVAAPRKTKQKKKSLWGYAVASKRIPHCVPFTGEIDKIWEASNSEPQTETVV